MRRENQRQERKFQTDSFRSRWALLVAALCAVALLGAGQGPAPDGGALRERARAAVAQTSGELRVPGLEQPVEVLRDTWGVAHIFAKTQHDLFFAQGFVAAQDRLWQLELWRRKAEGRLAEVLGPAAVERDRMARLLRYRGDWDAEWRSYSPDAREIAAAFVAGINAYIAQLGERLPIEFQLLGIRPEPWTPEVCVARLAAYPMTGNADDELLRAEAVRRLGPARAALIFPTDPLRRLDPPEGLNLDGLDFSVLSSLEAASGGVNFSGAAGTPPAAPPGSNNWAIAGARTASGKPILANDPHRALQLPSLRYLVHLVAPGWNVIGAGEPALPGVSIGHNERIAFGLTIFAADQQDLFIERTHADDANLYYDATQKNPWRKMEIFDEEIRVRGEAQPRRVQLKFTRHGPVIHEDAARHRATVLHWVGSEPGTAGYFAGIAISRAQNWQEFRRALARWKLPPENFVFADVDGNIGYQAAALVPVRETWDGLLPVPADSGQYEWRGFYTLDDLPHEFNPPRSYVATANHKTIPADEKRAIGFDWATPYRIGRIRQVLDAAKGHSVEDSERLQTDVQSVVAPEFVKLLASLPRTGAADDRRNRAVALLRAWDARLTKDSSAAAIYEVWVEKLREAVFRRHLPGELWEHTRRGIVLPTLLRVLQTPDSTICDAACRSDALAQSLDAAVVELERRLGPKMEAWRWGALHTAEFRHALGTNGERQAVFNRGPVERPGDGHTVNATGGGNFRQTDGASFRQIIDLGDFDKSVASNVPGQSGQPASPHYDDLLPLWARDAYFPLLFSRPAVEKHSTERLLLLPVASKK